MTCRCVIQSMTPINLALDSYGLLNIFPDPYSLIKFFLRSWHRSLSVVSLLFFVSSLSFSPAVALMLFHRTMFSLILSHSKFFFSFLSALFCPGTIKFQCFLLLEAQPFLARPYSVSSCYPLLLLQGPSSSVLPLNIGLSTYISEDRWLVLPRGIRGRFPALRMVS